MAEATKKVVTEAVGVFDGYDDLLETIKDLGTQGFGRHQISVRGSELAMEQHLGERSASPQMLEDNPEAPRSPLIGVEELGIAQGVLLGVGIYIGAVVAMVATDGVAQANSLFTIGAGSVLGAAAGGLLAWFLGSQYVRFFQKQVDTGGLVLWVETPDAMQVEKAKNILEKHGAHDVHVHAMPIAA